MEPAQHQGLVTEIVEIPLAVPLDTFMSAYETHFLPVLLRQQDIVSVYTGKVK